MNEYPADRSDGTADRWLTRLWSETSPADPGEDAWANVLARIEARAPSRARGTGQGPPRRRFPVVAVVLAGVSTAAAVVLAVLLAGPWPRPPVPTAVPDVQPFAVAGDDDVEILSMDAADLFALVVGVPPHRGLVELASLNDVTIDDTGHDVEVRITENMRSGPTSSPMIIMPLEGLAGKE